MVGATLAGGVDPSAFAAEMDAGLTLIDSGIQKLIGLAEDPAMTLQRGESIMDWTQRTQRLSNLLPVLDQLYVHTLDQLGCATDSPLGMFTSTDKFLAALLHIPQAEASRRVRAARLLTPATTPSGQRLRAHFGVLAHEQRTGEIAPDGMAMALKALTGWEKLIGHRDTVTPTTISRAEEVIGGQLKLFAGPDLKRVLERVGDHLNPDGILDDPASQQAVRSLAMAPITRGMYAGSTRISGILTPEVAAKTHAVIDPLTKPQHTTDESGRIIERDQRSHEMRMHDAFEEIIDRALRAGDLPAHGGTPATLILTASEDQVATRDGVATAEDGTRLPIGTALGLADEAEIARVTFDHESGDVLRLGRTRRIASYQQTLALIARDKGCTFPGCDRSAKWTQRHHIIDWAHGGNTDVENLVLVCGFHHHRFAEHGWSVELINGRAHWRPPRLIDPDRKPLINTKHHPQEFHLRT